MDMICKTLDLIWRFQNLASIRSDIDRLDSTHSGHRISIIYRPVPLGKRTIDFSEPTGTNRQKKQFKLDPKSKDIVFIHAV